MQLVDARLGSYSLSIELDDFSLATFQVGQDGLLSLASLVVFLLPCVRVCLSLSASLLQLLLEMKNTVLQMFDLIVEGLVIDLGSCDTSRRTVLSGLSSGLLLGCLELLISLGNLLLEFADLAFELELLAFVELNDLLQVSHYLQ